MEADFSGMKMSDFKSNLLEAEKLLQSKLGSDFEIRAESVIGNIALIVACAVERVEKKISFLTKQLSPNTADGTSQNAVFERVGLYRTVAHPTTFYLKVFGNSGLEIPAESLTVQSDLTREIFVNSESFTITETGVAKVLFKSLLKSEIYVTEGETFSTIEATDEILTVKNSLPENIKIGNSWENDFDFRERFEKSFDENKFCTRNSNINHLKNFVDHTNFLKIYDTKSDPTLSAGQILVVAKPNVDDETFAKKIFEMTPLGMNFSGNFSTEVELSNGQNIEVKFQKAEEIPIVLNLEISIKNGFFQSDVTENITQNVCDFFNKKFYGLGSKINAYEFVSSVLSASGTAGITNVSLQKTTESEPEAIINFDKFELPILTSDNIKITYS